jgi:hypothetical protein
MNKNPVYLIEVKQNYTSRIDKILAEHGQLGLWLPPYHPELHLTELIWATVNKSVADRNVTFRTEDVIKLADEKFASISKDDWKLRCNHVIAIEAQYIVNDALLDEGQKIVVQVGKGSSESDSSSDMSEDGDIGADEHGAGLYSISGIAPLNTDSDSNQQHFKYFGAVEVSCSGVIISTLQCYRKSVVIFCMSQVLGVHGRCFSLKW